jgi:carbon monoxide dehydrogenase subunit G
MKVHQEFDVAAERARVWAFFHDVSAVAECLPGATLTGRAEDGRYLGTLSTRLGPISTSFEGEAIVNFDDQAQAATIAGTGNDRRAGSRGQVSVLCTLVESGTGTHVDLDADVLLFGAAAQFGRTGLINEVSRRLIKDFSAAIETRLNAATTPAQ